MPDVTIPVYDGLPYLPIALSGDESAGGDVEIRSLNLGPLSLPINAGVTLPDFVFEPGGADGKRRFTNSAKSFNRTFEFPGRTVQLDRQFLTLSWRLARLRVRMPGGNAPFEITLEVFNLKIGSPVLPGIDLEADLGLTFNADGLDTSASYLKRYEPDADHLVPLDFKDFSSDNRYFALRWNDPNLNYWLQQLTSNFGEESTPVDRNLTLRIVFGEPIPEIRLDWESTTARTFVLPGLKVSLPGNVRYSVLLRSEGSSSPRSLRLIATVPANQTITASSNFAWERDGDRELQTGEDQNANDPLFRLDFITQKEVSLVLLGLDREEFKLPEFFRQFSRSLAPLNFNNADSLATPSSVATERLRSDQWQIKSRFNTSLFTLPFLKGDSFSQFISIKFRESPAIDLTQGDIIFTADASIGTSDLKFDTEFAVKFNWETFALKVEHDKGIELISPSEFLPTQSFLGLDWRFKGSRRPDGKFHHFTLITKDFNYQIQQAPDAAIEIDYAQASREGEPITFIVSGLAIAGTGISLLAQVSDRPARLNGLDTRFRFHGSQLEIRDNQIQDFTLAGSGPLPPALVGDAIADIALQFSQRDGGLTLVAGSAALQGEKLLHCQETRFQFSIDGLGLRFVNDGQFHLYFTLTGSAQYSPFGTDDPNGALALLGNIKIDLVECPLTGDASVIGKHVKFLIELPKPLSFSFLGCFEMELRGIGFLPQFEGFDGDPAMELSGQIKFAQGSGDVFTAQIDFHNLYIGLPKPGSFLPRLQLKELGVNIALGDAFSLEGVVEFRDELNEQGFLGEGKLEIPGLPVFAASFAFLRVRQDEESPWVRAWFIFLEVRQISFYIPYVELYIREVGLGFGYRYTLTSIKAADEAGDLGQLIGELRELSRTQGDLSKRDRWAVDLEKRGEDPRWTIVARALISQTSATPGSMSLKWLEQAEKFLPCLFLFDAVLAFRSDLTFFMAVRCWLNTNYYGFVNDIDGLRERPLFSGFVLLSVRQKRFLAQLSSNPDGSLGNLPPLPEFVENAVRNGQFSATFLTEPGLVHAELGWPNMLRWGQKIGPLEAEVSGGMIFRVTKHYLLLGISFKARASFSFDAGLDLGIVGVRVSARADAAYGARFIGLIDFNNTDKSALYAGIGLELRIRVSIAIWIKLLFIKKTFRLSLEVGFTAGLEFGISGVNAPGLRGTGTLFISAMGRRLQVSVKLGFNENAVQTALDRTAPFLNVGLEANDADRSIPGVSATQDSNRIRASEAAPAVQSLASRTVTIAAVSPGGVEQLMERAAMMAIAVAPEGIFNLPNYDIFVLRQPDSDGWGYFVLLPRAEVDSDESGIEANGFLPVPPSNTANVTADFALRIPENSLSENFVLQHFQPEAGTWVAPEDVSAIDWKVNWDAPIEQGTNHSSDGTPGEEASITLQRYLAYAFKTRPQINPATGEPVLDASGAPIEIPVGDPDPIADREERLNDERVQNPSEASYEAAVRGAEEQFRSSPFFKRDPDSAYEQVLSQAFSNTTTIYTASGETIATNEDGTPTEEQANQQAHQLRGMIVQDLIADLREYADAAGVGSAEATQPKPSADVDDSIAFQMGLVFRFRTTDTQQSSLPDWLQTIATNSPTLAQRSGPNSSAPDTFKSVRTFNIAQADFAQNPPQFEQVQQLTDTNTIAITWDLTWERPPAAGASACQQDPDHHLLHYQVRRRVLDGNEPEAVYTVKTGSAVHFQEKFTLTADRLALLQQQGFSAEVINGLQALNLEESLNRSDFLKAIDPAIGTDLPTEQLESILEIARNGQLTSLRPRFQLVDHFTAETLDDQVNLPATGRSYLYTITPIDFAGNAGRPLSLIATRYPSEPPRVPVDGKLTVNYRLDDSDLQPQENTVLPPLLTPSGIAVAWREPNALKEGPTVPVAKYRLIFRRDATLPIGSYGMDSSTQGPRSRSLPTSNARPLPTDIKIDLTPTGSPQERSAQIPLSTLQQLGVFPAGDNPRWQPESWRVFFQTISINEVPSALAPVQIRLSITSERSTEAEERQPAELEWLPKPIQFPMLPPEDQQAIVGDSHFPMPMLDASGAAPSLLNTEVDASGNLSTIQYNRHPAGIRLIRFRWNQGASNSPDYPLDLNASYTVLELDVDAFTRNTFTDRAQLAKALRPIQEVQMIPAEDLFLTPTDTLSTNLWEAWYPSAILRRRSPEARAEGSEIAQGPWYSWRDSYLEFPAWEKLGADRTEALHPFLQEIVDTLDENPKEVPLNGSVLPTFNVDIQFGPPMQPQEFDAFRQVTAPKADPYGWGILQRLGLSMAITLRDEDTSDLITGADLVTAIKNVLEGLRLKFPEFNDIYRHLHVELLFQPSRSINPAVGGVAANGLLAMVQFSLRPVVHSYLQYAAVTIKGSIRTPIVVNFELTEPCDVINQADSASGQAVLTPQPGVSTVQYTLTLPLKGETTLLLRGRTLPTNVTLAPVPKNGQDVLDNVTISPISPFAVTDERSTYFTVPSKLAQEFSNSLSPLGVQWKRFKQYVESINSTDPTQPRITIPLSEEGIKDLPIAEFLNWSQRFFDFSGTVKSDNSVATDEVAGEAWLVTAYPRASTPTYASPDASGRLTYDHLLENRWAHNYRYYIRPSSRYELLWRSLLQSPTLFPGNDAIRGTQLANHILSNQSLAVLESIVPADLLATLRLFNDQVFAGQPQFLQKVKEAIGDAQLKQYQADILDATETFPEALPDPNTGGLDVVVDRTRPVDKPLILNSTRLDAASTPGKPASPGTTWEVIIAQHPEQQLIERNQTLVRQLAFRQVAFSLLRRFAYADWVKQLENATERSHSIALQLVENQIPELPTAYPDQPDHLNLEQPLEGAIVRTLDLPQRIGNFQQGAMVVQWEALPFYYEHRLLVMAQTASTVSPINETIQRDFEYLSPDPIAFAESQQANWRPVPPFTGSGSIALRTRRLQIPLKRFWDSLPLSAQAQWSSDAPDSKDSQSRGRKPSSLPDRDVVYQIVEVFSGNVEVQAEFYFDPTLGKFALRQLGKRFLAELVNLKTPTTPQGDYVLDTTLQQISNVELIRNYPVGQILGNTRSKVALSDRLISFVGIFRREDRDNILLGSVPPATRPALQALLQAGLTSEEQLQTLFPVAQERRDFWKDFQTLDALYQSWFSAEAIAFPANFNLPPTNLSDVQALRNLLNTLPAEVAELRDLVEFVEPEDNTLVWTGTRSDADRAALNALADAFAGDASFADALRRIAARSDEADLLRETVFLGLERVPKRVRQPQGGQIQFSTNASHQRYTNLTWTGLLFDSQVDILRQWSHLPAFITGVNQLVNQLDQVTLTRTLPPPRPLQSELPDSIDDQLQIGATRLTWQKPDPTNAQRSALEALTGDDAFLDARDRLLTEIDRNPQATLSLDAFRPSRDSLPNNLREQLQYSTDKNDIIWIKPDPNPAQRQSLNDLIRGVEQFKTALQALLGEIDRGGDAVNLPDTAFRPKVEQLSSQIGNRLQIQENSLRWAEPAPTSDDREALNDLVRQMESLQVGLRDLLQAIDTDPSVNMQFVPRRPRSGDIPDSLQEQLSLTPNRQPTTIRWTGRIHSQEQLQALRNLTGDSFFNEAIESLINELIERSETIVFDLPVRPETPGIPETPENQLPGSIRDRLLLGRIQLRYHGLMTIAEGRALQTIFSSLPNQGAIDRLFNMSIGRGLQGSQLQIRTRRGSAPPSRLQALTPQEL